jgi:hypothetical protein
MPLKIPSIPNRRPAHSSITAFVETEVPFD